MESLILALGIPSKLCQTLGKSKKGDRKSELTERGIGEELNEGDKIR